MIDLKREQCPSTAAVLEWSERKSEWRVKNSILTEGKTAVDAVKNKTREGKEEEVDFLLKQINRLLPFH